MTATPAPADTPVNIAPPNWQCPHCLTKFREDLDAATECAHAGPAPQVADAVPVLVLHGRQDTVAGRLASLGLSEAGPVRPVRVDGTLAHHRLVQVSGETVDPRRLATAPQTADGLVVLAKTDNVDAHAPTSRTDLSVFGSLSTLFLGKSHYGEHHDTGVAVWVDEPSSTYLRDQRMWWRAPDDTERAALNVVTAGLLDKVAETDETALAAKIRAAYTPSRRRVGASRPEDLAPPAAGLAIAAAHGAPNHVWALRWLTTHLEEVTTWQARNLRAWASGEDHAVPCSSALRVAESLPNNPGKRRLATMEPFGEGYQDALTAVKAALVAPTPTNPIPDLGDVEQTVRRTQEGN